MSEVLSITLYETPSDSAVGVTPTKDGAGVYLTFETPRLPVDEPTPQLRAVMSEGVNGRVRTTVYLTAEGATALATALADGGW